MGGKCGSWALGLLWFLARLGIVGIGVSDFCSWSQGLCVLHPQCCCHLFVPKLVPPPWRTLSYIGAGLYCPRACCEPAPASHLLARSKVRQLSGLASAGPRVCWLDEYMLSYGHPSACSSAAGNVAQCSNYRYADSTSKWLELPAMEEWFQNLAVTENSAAAMCQLPQSHKTLWGKVRKLSYGQIF